MLKKLNLLCAILFLSGSFGFAQVGTGSIKGTVTDKNTGEALPFVKVVAFSGGQQQGFASTDFDGRYQISALTPTEYAIEVRFVGYSTVRNEGVVVNSNKITDLDIALTISEEMLDVVEVIEYTVPLIDQDGGASGATVTRDDISKIN